MRSSVTKIWLQKIAREPVKPLTNRCWRGTRSGTANGSIVALAQECAGKQPLSYVHSQLPISLELFLIEKLVEGCLVRKLRIVTSVTPDKLCFVTSYRQLEVKE